MSAIWTNITSPSVKDPTRKIFAENVVGNLTYLYNWLLGVLGTREVILNGSFESDADADSVPDGWVISLFTGGSFSFETSTSAADGKAYHGKRSIKLTSPGGASNGGGTATTENFFEVSEGRLYRLTFAMKSSVADVHNKIAINWYDSTLALISTLAVFDDATTNPTDWREHNRIMTAPANARYAKLQLYGCADDDTTAGSTWFDDVRMQSTVPAIESRAMFSSAGSYKWKCPAGVEWVGIVVIGGGGGGGGAAAGADGGGGGGAGGLSFQTQRLTPGTRYSFTVGAGGAGGAATPTDGSDGGNSTFAGTTTLTGAGGTGGKRATAGGTGGAGGAGMNGTINTTGATGDTRSGTTGGDAGEAPNLGALGAGGLNGVDGTAGPGYGGGGGGGGRGAAGGAGANGIVLLLW